MAEAPLVVSDLGSGGWIACGAGQVVAFDLPALVVCVIWAAGGPGQDCDVRPAAMPAGYSWTPTPSQRTSVNVGNDLVLPFPARIQRVGGQV